MPTVFVVIVNYHAPRLTATAVASLRGCQSASLEIVVVDNESSPGSLERLKAECPDCVLLPTDRNCGFGGGNNVGIRYALEHGAKWVLLLNNDTEVRPDFLAPLLKAAEDGKTVATPKILYADDQSRIWYGGGRVDYSRGGFYHETDEPRASESRDVDFASGCCLLCPADLLRTLDGMDEDYFLYYEDAAFCLRARAAGYRIHYVPESVILHKVSATTGPASKLTSYYGTRNRLAVLSRFGFPKRAFAYVLATRVLRLLFSMARPDAWHVLPGVIDWLRGRRGCRVGLPWANFPVVVNGVFAGRQGSGLERFAVETLRALDDRVRPGQFQLLVPRRADLSGLPAFRNIEVVRYGRFRGGLWEQFDLARYARRHGRKVLSLTNTVPLRHADYACVHDVFYVTHAKEFNRTLKGVLSMAWHRLHYRAIARRSKVVLTVSDYSAGQIAQVLGVPLTRIAVLGNGWEHMRRIEPDESVFDEFPRLARGEYFFTLGNRAPYKNMEWIFAAAAAHPETVWAVTGSPLRTSGVKDRGLSNVIYTGRLPDGKMKALMENCRVLVHPSLDEGFGIPPLEALSVGRPILVARVASLPEIYGEAAYWIENPLDRDGRLDLREGWKFKSRDADLVLANNTWEKVAGKLLEAIT